MRRLLAVLPLVLLTTAACGSEGPRPLRLGHGSMAISGGQSDSTDTGVVGIVIQMPTGTALCSGTLLAPNLVLTARHCVAAVQSTAVVCGQTNFGAKYPASDFLVENTQSISQQSNWHTVSEVRVPSTGTDMCGYDVALLILNQSFSGSVAKPIVPRIDKSVQVGEGYTAVGYGTIDGQQHGGGSRLERSGLLVSWYQGASLASVCSSQVCGYGLESSEWEGQTGVCEGDSGGPALDANGKEIGVVSRGGQNCSTPIYSSVTAWASWIKQGALDAAQAGGYSPPSWATTGSSGGSGGTGGTGGGTGGVSSGGTGATGGGTGGTGGAQGQTCSSSAPCPNGYQCVYDSDPSKAYCAADCSSSSNSCGGGLVCNGHLHACMHPASASTANSSSGCSVSEHGPASPAPWAIGLSLLGLAAVVRRRRR